jgi:hypothetical protein
MNAKVERDELEPFGLEEVESIVQDLYSHNTEDADYFKSRSSRAWTVRADRAAVQGL